MNLPTLVAHRGYAACYPENSLEGLQAAVAAGAGWLEFDVQLSTDGVPVLLHDTTLLRTAGHPDSVFDMTADQLRKTCIGEPA
jgi:glycerophosphoryl diester phosphodiesterase